MRAAAIPGSLAVAIACALPLAGCGPSARERLEAATLASAAPVVESFASDLEAGRYAEALRRTTRGFQGDAAPAAVASVHAQLRRAAGAPKSRSPRGVESLETEGDTEVVRSAVVLLDGAFERTTAEIRARVQRDASGGWLVDGYEVRSGLFTFTLRK